MGGAAAQPALRGSPLTILRQEPHCTCSTVPACGLLMAAPSCWLDKLRCRRPNPQILAAPPGPGFLQVWTGDER